VVEDYHLVCLKSALDEPAVQALCTVLQGADWQRQLQQLPGYQAAAQSGQVLAMSRLLPWWNYRSAKKKPVAKTTRRGHAAQRAQERKPLKMSSRPGRK